MRAHIVENGVIVNTVLVSQLGAGMIDGNDGNIGDLWNGSVLTKVERKPGDVVDTWKLKFALAKDGNVPAVDAAITDPVDRVRWNDKPTIRRGDKISDIVKQTLSLTNKQLDVLFSAAGD